MQRIFPRLLVIVALLAGSLPAITARAQESSRTFPETGFTVSGRFLQYWQQNGGLPVFGFPLSNQFEEGGRQVQYFERQRFELHPENAPPYDVLLGRLGDELLLRRGVNWQDIAPGQPIAGCQFFEVTRHNVCDQAPGQGFLSYWRSNGLDFGDPGVSFHESLALWGYPLTEAFVETNPDGDTVLTQWFERARFEWHPNNPMQYRVLLGRLGAEIRPVELLPTVSQVNLYLIAVGDAGAQGRPIGCDDSLVAVRIDIPPTTTPLTAAYQRLLALNAREFGESGFYNALYQSDLQLQSATVENGTATVRLTGTLRLGGVCDNPRVEAQLEETALQFPTVDRVNVFINGEPLEDVLSLQ